MGLKPYSQPIYKGKEKFKITEKRASLSNGLSSAKAIAKVLSNVNKCAPPLPCVPSAIVILPQVKYFKYSIMLTSLGPS